MTFDGDRLSAAFLHDPPDKALLIRGHVPRAEEYAQVIGISEKPVPEADHVASAVERMPSPKAEKVTVGPVDGKLRVHHPLSGDGRDLQLPALDEAAAMEPLRAWRDLEPRLRFLALWRLWPDALAKVHPSYDHLPADTRCPDHTIWHHLDAASAMAAEGAGDRAFLSFSVGPVQQFIAAARTVRDLWSGSMILSYLTFKALLPVVEAAGPGAVVFPSLRGLPLFDQWLRGQPGLAGLVGPPEPRAMKSPCLPNRFVAVVDRKTGDDLARQCEDAAQKAWSEIAEAVKGVLDANWRQCMGWDRLWNDQINNYFDVRTALLPWLEADGFTTVSGEALDVHGLVGAMPSEDRPGHDQQSPIGSWQHRLELSARLDAATKVIRRFPKDSPTGENVPGKCSLLGTFEQMGPATLNESREFWERVANDPIHGIRIGRRDRFCAVSLAKRLCSRLFFRDELGLTDDDLRYEDTATVAAAGWLEDRGLDPARLRNKYDRWSGQWLHWGSANQDEDDPCPADLFRLIQQKRGEGEKPSAYYAVLMIDGDSMGEWLAGKKTHRVRDVYHPELVRYFDGLRGPAAVQAAVQAGLDAPRPVGPAMHAALSTALANFAVQVVPEIVEKHKGTLIYAGGDDVLALLPTRSVLDCAAELRRAFRGELDDGAPAGYVRKNGRDLLVMGPTATFSAGVAVVHYKEDLRFALQTAREAEKRAKNAGRDILELAVCRRSGEHGSGPVPWDLVPDMHHLIGAFVNKASDRWAYHLRGEQGTLGGLPVDAIRAEIRRVVNRAEDNTHRLLGQGEEADDRIVGLFNRLRDRMNDPNRLQASGREPGSDANALRDFITLCQAASFLARGREE